MDRPNIILIVADTMRRDAIGIYNKNVSTPNIDALARDSMVYNNAISPSPWTAPSHASIFTGQYPNEHGVHEENNHKTIMGLNYNKFLNLLTIAQQLTIDGYNCLGFTQNAVLNGAYGYDRGFNVYQMINKEYNDYENIVLTFFNENERKLFKEKKIYDLFKCMLKNRRFKQLTILTTIYLNSKKIKRERIEKISKLLINENNSIKTINMRLPFFLFSNVMYMHEPYLKSDFTNYLLFRDIYKIKPIPKNIIKKIKRIYYQRSTLVDNYVGNVVSYLKDNKLYNNSVIIFTSDHGQELYENRFYGHGLYLHDELIRVPLIIKYPKEYEFNGNFDDLISLTDIYKIIKIISSGSKNFNSLKHDYVFAESFGYQNNVREFFDSKRIKKNLNNMIKNGTIQALEEEIYLKRKAIFWEDYKLVLKENGDVEEFTKNLKKTNILEHFEIFKSMIDNLEIFIGNEQFTLPDISKYKK